MPYPAAVLLQIVAATAVLAQSYDAGEFEVLSSKFEKLNWRIIRWGRSQPWICAANMHSGPWNDRTLFSHSSPCCLPFSLSAASPVVPQSSRMTFTLCMGEWYRTRKERRPYARHHLQVMCLVVLRMGLLLALGPCLPQPRPLHLLSCSAAQSLPAPPRRHAAATSSRPPRATTAGTGRCGLRREG